MFTPKKVAMKKQNRNRNITMRVHEGSKKVMKKSKLSYGMCNVNSKRENKKLSTQITR